MINTTIGKYKIIRMIGEGGMASVYEAEHEMLGTKVAIKVLNPILSSNTQIRERFKNEARLMASLNHPNITKVLDFEEGNSQLSIVMELLEGENLNERIKRIGSLSEKEITEIFSQTLSAFQYAHEKNIVHRDIKPSNIFILSNGQVKILDFGVAKLVGQGSELTQTGTQLGTPVYMSPEQVKAEKDIDHRSDIYSLGVTLYFAIKGNPPYNSNTDSQFNIFNRIVFEPIPNLKVGDKYDQMIQRACCKEKEGRYQSCSEWILELGNITKKVRKSSSNEKTSVGEAIQDKTLVDNSSQTVVQTDEAINDINKQTKPKRKSTNTKIKTDNDSDKINSSVSIKNDIRDLESNLTKRKSQIWIFYFIMTITIIIASVIKFNTPSALMNSDSGITDETIAVDESVGDTTNIETISVTNNCSTQILFAIGYFDSSKLIWVSKGWYHVNSGESFSYEITKTTGVNNFYWYATESVGDKEWSGTDMYYCVSQDAFELNQDAECEYTKGFRSRNYDNDGTNITTITLSD